MWKPFEAGACALWQVKIQLSGFLQHSSRIPKSAHPAACLWNSEHDYDASICFLCIVLEDPFLNFLKSSLASVAFSSGYSPSYPIFLRPAPFSPLSHSPSIAHQMNLSLLSLSIPRGKEVAQGGGEWQDIDEERRTVIRRAVAEE
jgi:hypothetical protein